MYQVICQPLNFINKPPPPPPFPPSGVFPSPIDDAPDERKGPFLWRQRSFLLKSHAYRPPDGLSSSTGPPHISCICGPLSAGWISDLAMCEKSFIVPHGRGLLGFSFPSCCCCCCFVCVAPTPPPPPPLNVFAIHFPVPLHPPPPSPSSTDSASANWSFLLRCTS